MKSNVHPIVQKAIEEDRLALKRDAKQLSQIAQRLCVDGTKLPATILGERVTARMFEALEQEMSKRMVPYKLVQIPNSRYYRIVVIRHN